MFFATVEDRSAQTLIPLIKRWIRPGTKILSDCWKSYASLQEEGYLHETVNHSVTFVSETGVHTNTIESRWLSLKKSLPKYGTTKGLYESYLAEYCIRRKYLDTAEDSFLKLIAKVYSKKGQKRGEELDSEEEEEIGGEQVSAAEPAQSVERAGPLQLLFTEQANFDLKFDVWSDSDDKTFNYSSDLFD